MVFDGDLSLCFHFTDEAAGKGHTILSWKSHYENDLFGKISRYTNSVFSNGNNETVNGFGHATYPSFRCLIKSLSLDKTNSIVNNTINTLLAPIKQILSITVLPQGQSHQLIDVYEAIVKAIDSGQLEYPDVLTTVTLLDKNRKPISRECKWRDNAANGLKLGTNHGT